MKNCGLLIISILCVVILTITGCSQFGYVVGAGPTATKTYDYSDFTGVEVASSFEFDINQSASYSVSISANENLVDYLDVYKSGTTLIIRLKNSRYASPNPRVTITMPELHSLVVSGAAKGSAEGFKSTAAFNLTASGASQLVMNLEAGATRMDLSGASKVSGNLKSLETRLNVSGASRCELNGSAGPTNIEVSGASQVNLPDFQLRNADISLTGASTATINVNGTLNLDLTGASTLNYLGNPILSKVSVSGASKINAK